MSDEEKIKNIVFDYADNLVVDKDRERYMTVQANIWLKTLVKRFNDENAVVHFLLREKGENRVYFTGMSKDLEVEAMERLRLFQNPEPL